MKEKTVRQEQDETPPIFNMQRGRVDTIMNKRTSSNINSSVIEEEEEDEDFIMEKDDDRTGRFTLMSEGSTREAANTLFRKGTLQSQNTFNLRKDKKMNDI